MARKLRSVLAVLILTAVSLGCSTTKPPEISLPFNRDYPSITPYLSSVIKREMKKAKITGLSIALVDRNKMVWSEGFGFADKANEIEASPNTVYRTGSISKLFNAVAVMQLVEQGKLDLDAPLVQYLPEFKIRSRFGRTDDITLRALLSHQAGLPRDHIAGMWGQDQQPIESLLPILEETYVTHPANKIFAYSNMGVSLSGLAVQRNSGQTYETYMQRQVLDVLGMNQSDFSGRLEGPNASAAYIKNEQVTEPALRDLPAGGLNSTVVDMAKFISIMLAQGSYGATTVLDSDTVLEMYEVQNQRNQLDFDRKLGLGWLYEDHKLDGQYDVLGHNGATLAHVSKLAMVPELGIGVIVLSNSAPQSNALQIIAEEALLQLSRTHRPLKKIKPDLTPKDGIIASGDLAGDYAGAYGRIQIKPDGKKFKAQALDMKVSLHAVEDNWYAAKLKVGFITLPSSLIGDLNVTRSTMEGREVLIGVESGKAELLGVLIDPAPASPVWDARLGNYLLQDASDLDKQFNFEKVALHKAEGYYYVEIGYGKGEVLQIPVQAVNDKELVELGLGTSLGDTIAYSGSGDNGLLKIAGRVFKPE